VLIKLEIVSKGKILRLATQQASAQSSVTNLTKQLAAGELQRLELCLAPRHVFDHDTRKMTPV
jgi:hypothetical protein